MRLYIKYNKKHLMPNSFCATSMLIWKTTVATTPIAPKAKPVRPNWASVSVAMHRPAVMTASASASFHVMLFP